MNKQLGLITPGMFQSYNDYSKALKDAGFTTQDLGPKPQMQFDIMQWLSDYWYIPAAALLLYILMKK